MAQQTLAKGVGVLVLQATVPHTLKVAWNYENSDIEKALNESNEGQFTFWTTSNGKEAPVVYITGLNGQGLSWAHITSDRVNKTHSSHKMVLKNAPKNQINQMVINIAAK